jgi:Iron-containing redox enzyme
VSNNYRLKLLFNSKGGTVRNSQQLRRKIRLVSGGLERAAHAFWTHAQLRELFPEFLLFDYSISRATTPVMEAAYAVARTRSNADPVAACVAEYLSRHIPEELHHDEWLLADLEALGHKREQVLERLPSPTAAALVGAQYYWVFHAHPVGLLGYLAVLEGEPPSTMFLEEVVAKSGLPAEAFRTFIKHGYLDPQHRDDLNDALDRMPLNAQHTALVGISAIQTVHWLHSAFEELLESHSPSHSGGPRSG